MGLFSRFRKKKEWLDEPRFPTGGQPAGYAQQPGYAMPVAPAVPTSAATGSLKAELDLVLSQMENMRMQYEAISARLQNIEKLVAEIRSFCR